MRRYRAIAEYYDAEYEGNPMLDSDVPFFLGHLPRRPQRVLELAVGTARAAIPIAQAGHRVIGVDYAPDMLAIARRKRDAVGLTDRHLRLIRQDVTRLRLPERFDWICLFFNTFLNFITLREQDRLLQAVRAHLKPGGHFWLDIFQPNLELLAQDRRSNIDPATFFVAALDRTVSRITDVVRDQAAQLQNVTFRYRWFDADGQEHREQIAFQLTFMFPRELRLLLERNGLILQRLYGNYDGSTVHSDSPRLIALCRPARR